MIKLFGDILKIVLTQNFIIGLVVGALLVKPLFALAKWLFEWVKLGWYWIKSKIFRKNA